MRETLGEGESVLLEGAQATLLVNDHGTYPFVTSSNPSVGGAVVGSGIPPRALDQVIGVTKAYTTRVGDGPFPTELLDVLSAVEEIKICVGYEIGGKRVDEFPMSQTDLHHAQPVYKQLPGWGVNVTGCRMRGDLPEAAQDFVGFVEAEVGAPLCMISVGPERDQAIIERIGT